MDSKIVKNITIKQLVFYASKRKMLTNKNGSKLALLCVCQVQELAIYETCHSREPPTPHGSPTTRDRQTSIFLFSRLYTTMVTKKK